MKAIEIIQLGLSLGLNYYEDTQHDDMIKQDIIVFSGANGQRFVIKGEWSKKKIHQKLGEALIDYGKRLKAIQISNALSIVND